MMRHDKAILPVSSMTVVSLAVFLLYGGATAKVTVTENTASRVSFVFELEEPRIEAISTPAGTYTAVEFAGSNTDVGKAGEIVLPARAVHVGVPEGGAVRVGFSPVATRSVSVDAPPRRRPSEYPSAEHGERRFADPWVSEVRYTMVRGHRVATVVIKPFLYDEASRRLTVCTRGICTIRLPAAGPFGGRALPAGSEFAALLRRTLLNYDVARRWRVPADRALSKAVAHAALPASSSYLRFTVGDGSRGGREARTDENGLVRIPGSVLVNSFGSGARIGSIELLAAPRGELSTTTPSLNMLPPGVTTIPVIPVDHDEDGRLDREDYLLAYTTGTSDWHGDTVSGKYWFELNHYDDERSYWLRYGGTAQAAIMDTFTPPEATPADTFSNLMKRVMLKESVALPQGAKGGKQWRWALLSSGMARTFPLGIGDAAVDLGGAVRLHKAASKGDSLIVRLGGREICDSCEMDEWRAVESWDDQDLEITVGGTTDTFELAAIEVEYRVTLGMRRTSSMLVFSPTESGVHAYRLGGLPDERVYIVRVSEDERDIKLIAALPASADDYLWADTGGIGVKYHIRAESAIREVTPERYGQRRDQGMLVRDLRAHGDEVDYLVITSEELVNEAVRLAEHKRDHGRFRHAKVVETRDIYREFAGGNRDPMAIRNFLVYAAGRWGAGPDYVVLFGNGHYDYKGHLGTREANHIPAPQIGEKCYDDIYVYLDPSETPTTSTSTPDIAVGRIPCYNAAEARAVVDKIIELEGDGAERGAWRNRVLLVADDDKQGHEDDQIKPAHYVSSEEVYRAIVANRDFVELSKIYLYEYEWDELLEKPEANRALVNAINGGVACVNYFGHGADQLWADEHVFKTEEVASLRNRGRYPLITSFSCSVGRFDKPGHESLSDALVRAASAGAIATVSSTRLAYARENEKLAKAFYGYLFERESPSGSPRSIGQALLAAKLHQDNSNSNQKTYALLGDPSIRFVNMTDTVRVTIRDSRDQSLDTLKALQTVTIQGTIRRNGRVNTTFGDGDSAFVHLALYNPPLDSVRRKDGGSDNTIVYPLPGSPVFVGGTRVVRGRFEQTALLPKKVVFDQPGVKLVAYAWDGTRSAGGLIDSLLFHGSDPNEITDTEGPRIMVRPVAGDGGGAESLVGYTDKLTGTLPLSVEIGIYDRSGIDVVGTGPDEGLTVEVPSVMSRWNINHKFQFADGDYRKGTATLLFEEDDLEQDDTYTMTITAQDLIGNVSRLSVDLEVSPGNSIDGELSLDHVFTYPNPFRVGETTRFFFHHTKPYGDEEATIRIYTLSGKLVKVFRNARDGQEWNGTDAFGRRLGPNAYLYRVSVRMGEGRQTEESDIKKVVIHPPR